jgi:Glucose / Sorbosone dehydrogenase
LPALLLAAMFWAANAQAVTLQQVGAGFDQPIYVTSDPGNPNRLFVVEREGSVVLLQNGEAKPFADISSEVSCCEGERGLLSIALSPDFDSSGRFFLYYTGEVGEPGEIHVAEMVASGNSAPSSTLRDVIPPIPHEQRANHDGGQLQFGPEGALFFGTGDGGGEDDELHNAQKPASQLGKLLRLPSPGLPKPGPPKSPEIWSLGLRNPFRFSFDRQTGDLWIGDVGQGQREEVDFAAAPSLGQGSNYGWNCMEGSIPGPATDPCVTPPVGGYVPPVFEYPHDDPGAGKAFGCAIIGGYVGRDPGLGDLYGRYVYGDLCQGEIRSFCPASPAATDRSESAHVNNLNSFGEDSSGRLYAVSGNGPVYRLVGQEGALCPTVAPIAAPAAEGAVVVLHRHPHRQPQGQAAPPWPDHGLGDALQRAPWRPGDALARAPEHGDALPGPSLLGALPAADRPPLQLPGDGAGKRRIPAGDLAQADDQAGPPPSPLAALAALANRCRRACGGPRWRCAAPES